MIITALLAVYIVLGILYESYIHPVTILSTIPSAGVGALLALKLTHNELNVIGLIGIILLIGLVKKERCTMIDHDFALDAERKEGKSPLDAIYEACVLRFRPIMMTTAAALLGGLPLALGTGTGSELRRPLGLTIVGGLIYKSGLDFIHYSDSSRVVYGPAAPAFKPKEGRVPGTHIAGGQPRRLDAEPDTPVLQRSSRNSASQIEPSTITSVTCCRSLAILGFGQVG